jgi:hypothetical protein
MSAATAPGKIPDSEFLDIRSKIVALAAMLDRIRRPPGIAAGDPRIDTIARGLQVLASGAGGCAEEVQMVFSLPYDEHWR